MLAGFASVEIQASGELTTRHAPGRISTARHCLSAKSRYVHPSWESARTGAALGSIRALSSLDRTVFADPFSPDIANSGYGPLGRNAANSQATIRTKSFWLDRLRNE